MTTTKKAADKVVVDPEAPKPDQTPTPDAAALTGADAPEVSPPPGLDPQTVPEGATHVIRLACGCTHYTSVPVATSHHCTRHDATLPVERRFELGRG